MTTSRITPKASRAARIAMLVIAAMLCTGVSAQAGPVTGPLSGALALVKSAVTLPFYVTSKAVQGVSKTAKKSGTKDATKN